MTRFRCGKCEREFVADKPTCAKCGLDPDVEPRHEMCFMELRTTHYDPPTHVPGIGKNHAACDPTLRTGTNGDSWTGEKKFVNCEKCKESEVFKADAPPPVPVDTIRTMPLAEVEALAREAKELA